MGRRKSTLTVRECMRDTKEAASASPKRIRLYEQDPNNAPNKIDKRRRQKARGSHKYRENQKKMFEELLMENFKLREDLTEVKKENTFLSETIEELYQLKQNSCNLTDAFIKEIKLNEGGKEGDFSMARRSNVSQNKINSQLPDSNHLTFCSGESNDWDCDPMYEDSIFEQLSLFDE